MSRLQIATKSALQSAAMILLLIFMLGGALCLFLVAQAAQELPGWNKASFRVMPSVSTIYDHNGKIVTQLRGKTYRLPVKLEQVAPVMQDAIVAVEDARFYDHDGIDYLGLGRALLNDLRGGAQEGASTLTQQLVKNVLLSPEQTISRKIKEALLARQVESAYSKREILELYLNTVYFGEGANGIEAASRTYFNKPAAELNLPESALLAGLAKNPYRFSPCRSVEEAKNRRTTVLQLMLHNGYIGPQQYASALKASLPTQKHTLKDDYPYPFFLDHVIEELIHTYGLKESDVYDGGLQIYTTLDCDVQKTLEEEYADKTNFPPSVDAQLPESAMVVIEPASGSVRGLVGGRYHVIRRGYNRATMLKRQPGSTFKPLVVYSPAIEKGYGPATLLDSSNKVYGSNSAAYAPTNMNNSSWGKISMRKAIDESVNTYAINLLNLIGIDAGYDFGKRLGLTSLNSQDKVLGLALGGTTEGLSPLELASAYAPLANRGIKIETHTITKVTDGAGKPVVQFETQPKRVMQQATADMMTDLLRSAVKDGTGRAAELTDRPAAGKTGTTELPELPEFKQIKQGNKDAWFAGYTPELLGVVWLGYDTTNPTHYLKKIYGGTYPAMIWHKVFTKILANKPPSHFAAPPQAMVAAEQRLWVTKAKAKSLPPKNTGPTHNSKADSPQKAVAKPSSSKGNVPPNIKRSRPLPAPKSNSTNAGLLNKLFSYFTR
ncbi:MAG: PBP1A family penicillin-binding protein [Peptococcaceae bacterium]|nr:PBP1A family penicillin-binding protein [Peptococcaceae bacterium]